MDFSTGFGGSEWIWALGIFVLVVLPGLFTLILKSNTFAIGIILTTAFTRVLFHFAGMPRLVPVLITEFCVLLLLAKALYLRLFVRMMPLRVVGFYPMAGILGITLISFVLNASEMLPAVFFVRQIFVFYLFFIALLNLDLSQKTVMRINRYIIFLFLIQLPAAATKYLVMGQDELWSGTVSWQAGQFSTTLPLFAIAFLLSFYLFRRKKVYILLVVAFVFFGLAGQKRAVPILLPSLALLLWFLYWRGAPRERKRIFGISKLKTLALMLTVAFVALFSYASISRDEMYMHGLDLGKLYEYTVWYNTRDEIAMYGTDDDDLAMGRITITRISLDRLKRGGLVRQMVGFGPGAMISSPHLGREDIAFRRFGIRGALTGFVIFMLQSGMVGVILLTFFFLRIFAKAYRVYKGSDDTDFRMVALGLMGATYVFLLDFFIYSPSSLFFGVLTPVYFYIATIVLNRDYRNYRLFGKGRPSQGAGAGA